MMRLPWRRKWLIGFDLEGNTFWEFKDALHAGRTRRIVKYSHWVHHSDVNLPPQWVQWLRQTRFEPPSLAEQQADVVRQAQMKMLAAQADARWAAKPSMLDAPNKQQPIQPLESRDQDSGIRQMNVDQDVRDRAQPPTMPEDTESISAEKETVEDENTTTAPTLKQQRVMKKEPKDSPWKQAARANPGEDWQPKEWAPGPAKRRA
jgi:NADH dehydrogenase [ubiquinone] 1 alpha subcomplex assembly factor 2